MLNKTILLFTDSFPYGKAEPFLEAEIVYLAKKFKVVYIFPSNLGENERPLPSNCIVVDPAVKFKAEKKMRFYVLKNWYRILKFYFYLLIASEKRKYYFKNLGAVIVDLALLLEEAYLYLDILKEYLEKSNLIYFYWFRKPVINFALLKTSKRISHKLVARAHGYDYDPSRNVLGFYLYRELELNSLDNLVVASNWGAKLERKIYPKYSSKISSCHLGVANDLRLNPTNVDHVFHLVSCSFITKTKRVDLILEILKYVKIELKWTHIGDGNLLEIINQQSSLLPQNISCEFLGFRSNSFILDYYKMVPCDLFITTTLLEGGVPVSIMEAIAHGIPVIGPSIAGVPEIVNDQTGFLIPKDFDPKEIAELINNYSLKSTDQRELFRKSARQFYEKNFDAERNFNFFIDRYLNS